MRDSHQERQVSILPAAWLPGLSSRSAEEAFSVAFEIIVLSFPVAATQWLKEHLLSVSSRAWPADPFLKQLANTGIRSSVVMQDLDAH